MRFSIVALSFALIVTLFIFNIQNTTADPLPIEGDLIILGYYGDAVRADDRRTMSMSESYFFNNSGTERFSGNITLWFQQGAYIASDLCGSNRNQIARVESGPKLTCIDMTAIDSETFIFKPFTGNDFLSFYGEGHSLILNSSSLNTSSYSHLNFNVTLGSTTRASQTTENLGNITMSTSSVELGSKAFLTWGPLRNLTVSQKINFTNNGGLNETISLDLLNIPTGWSASIIYEGTPQTSIYLQTGQQVEIALNISAPSYIVHIYAEYTLFGTETSSGGYSLKLQRLFPYNTTFADLRLYTLENDEVSASNGFEVHGSRTWVESTQRFTYQILGFEILNGTVSELNVEWKPPPLEIPMWIIAVLLVLIGILIAYPILRRKRADVEEDAEDMTEKPPVNLTELRKKKETLIKSLERLETEEQQGTVSPDVLTGMKQGIQSELTQIEKQLGFAKTLQIQKKSIIKALKKLETDYKAGRVDKDVYESLKSRYEEEALKILKQIDQKK